MGSTKSSTSCFVQLVRYLEYSLGYLLLHYTDRRIRYTGYDTSWQLPFDIIGRNGVNLNEKWKPHPTSYLSMCVDEFPNMFMCLGPNSILGAGLVLPVLEYTVMYAVQATAKMQRERLKSIEAKPEVVRAFDDYIEVGFVFDFRSPMSNCSGIIVELLS